MIKFIMSIESFQDPNVQGREAVRINKELIDKDNLANASDFELILMNEIADAINKVLRENLDYYYEGAGDGNQA